MDGRARTHDGPTTPLTGISRTHTHTPLPLPLPHHKRKRTQGEALLGSYRVIVPRAAYRSIRAPPPPTPTTTRGFAGCVCVVMWLWGLYVNRIGTHTARNATQ